jgi:hypothetical protein
MRGPTLADQLRNVPRAWLTLSIALAASALASGARAQEATAVVLGGDPALVAEVTDELARRAVAIGAAADDRTIRVDLTPTEDGMRLALRDSHGQTAERRVSTVETAAALIESWARPAIADPLLAPRRPPPAPTVQRAPPPAPAADPQGWTPVLRLGGETPLGQDGSLWLGGRAGACTRVRSACLGPEVRYARRLDQPAPDLVLRGDGPVTWARTDWAALLLVQWQVALGRPLLLLGLAAGIGQRPGEDTAELGARGEARLGVMVPLWSRLAIDAGVTATLAGSRTELWALPRDERPIARSVRSNPLRAEVGLRWGTP